MAVEKSGVHITGADSGWPVGAASEPPYRKDGSGTDVVGHKVSAVAGGVVTDQTSTNEIQTVTVTGAPTGGGFKLTFNGEQTASIPTSAVLPTAAGLQAALEALPSVNPGDVTVVGSNGGPFTVTFKGQYTDQDVAQMTKDATGLTGGTSPNVTVATTTPGSP